MIFFTEPQAKSKWRTLCTTFQKELARVPKVRSGAAAQNVSSSSWIHFEGMKFLANKANNGTSGNFGLLNKAEEEPEDGLIIDELAPSKSSSARKPIQPAEPTASSILEADGLFFNSFMPYLSNIKSPQRKLQFQTEFDILLMSFLEKNNPTEEKKESENGKKFL